jgi:hypothetical protein
MQPAELLQRTVFEQSDRIALRLPLGKILGALHPDGCFPLAEDPRETSRATLLGMMVLRPADHAWMARSEEGSLIESMRSVDDWCFDVEGLGGSWAISGGSALDAYRLALQYGTMDAVLAGAATVAREGLVAGARRGHLWQPYTPLSWAVLQPWRDTLEPAIAALRRDWQEIGVLSARRYPAQVAISASGRIRDGAADILDARMFHDTHPDGSAMESYVLTSEAGAERLRERARTKGSDLSRVLLVSSPANAPEEIDLSRVPGLLRTRLDARVVEHDGGAATLEAFERAGAIAQLNLTLMRGRSVRDVVASTTRLDAATRDEILRTWEGRARMFPGGGALRDSWTPLYALEEAKPGGEAVVVTLGTGYIDQAESLRMERARSARHT